MFIQRGYEGEVHTCGQQGTNEVCKIEINIPADLAAQHQRLPPWLTVSLTPKVIIKMFKRLETSALKDNLNDREHN